VLEVEAIVAEKLYAGSRGRPAENIALLDKIRIFVHHLQFIDFPSRLHYNLWGDASKFGRPTIFRAFIVDETSIFYLFVDVFRSYALPIDGGRRNLRVFCPVSFLGVGEKFSNFQK